MTVLPILLVLLALGVCFVAQVYAIWINDLERAFKCFFTAVLLTIGLLLMVVHA